MAKIIPAEEKVFMVSKSTNTTYSGSAALKAMQEWYTMDDVSNTVKPYKVFTALLTQSGGDVLLSQSSGTVQIGVTYFVAAGTTTPGVTDFTNVGGKLQTDDTPDYYFVATATAIPNNYGSCDITYNTGAPVATVLENTIGNIWFSYSGVGSYSLNLLNGFPANKTFYDKNYQFISPTDIDDKALILYAVLDSVNIYTTNYDLTTPKNDVLLVTPIEIRVYN